MLIILKLARKIKKKKSLPYVWHNSTFQELIPVLVQKSVKKTWLFLFPCSENTELPCVKKFSFVGLSPIKSVFTETLE